MSSQPFIGIDFGTCNSSMAWFDPRTGEAKEIRNAEGEDKTPSIVYFGSKEILVGRPAENLLESPEERKQMLSAVKQELAKSRVWMKSGRRVTAVEATAEILKKLKRDAEDGLFHEPVLKAVITCPASFDELEKDRLREAATKAGFREMELLEEPVAAAVAYAQSGVKVGRHVLVYDLGGGTFDLALLTREEEEDVFRLAMHPLGDRVGGEDFDRAIYRYFDEAIQRQVGQPFCSDGIDIHLLRQCRRYKENLTVSEEPAAFSWFWPGKGRLKNLKLNRGKFEELIREYVERTVEKTQSIRDKALAMGYDVGALILIGGSSRVPLVAQQLRKTLHVEPLKWEKQDIAVALGAAYHANRKWGEMRSGRQETSTPTPPNNRSANLDFHLDLISDSAPTPSPSINDAADQYRRAVKWVWRNQVIEQQDLEQLVLLAQQLGLSRVEAGVVEFEVIGDFKETAFDRRKHAKAEQKASLEMRCDQYRNEINALLTHARKYHNGKPLPSFIELLREKGLKAGLSLEEAKEIERKVLNGFTVDEIPNSHLSNGAQLSPAAYPCPKCGFISIADDTTCPSCGTTPSPPNQERGRKRSDAQITPTSIAPIKDAADSERRETRKRTFQADHRGKAVRILGVLSIVLGLLVPLGGLIFGIVTMVIGKQDLTEMQEGRMDAGGASSTRSGWTYGLIGTCLGFVFLFVYLPRFSLWAFLASKL